MRQTAGVVCGIITILIYGAALLLALAAQQQVLPDDRWKVWLTFIAVAAVFSAIHHALWSIIDNQVMLYGTLKEQENKLDMIMRNLESQPVNTGFVPQQATPSNPPAASNVSQQNAPNYGSWSTDDTDQSSWECPKCGATTFGSRCKSCGFFKG